MRVVSIPVRRLSFLRRVRDVDGLCPMIDAAADHKGQAERFMLDFRPRSQARVDEMIDTIRAYVPNWSQRLRMEARYGIRLEDWRKDREFLGVSMTFARREDVTIVVLHSLEDTQIVRHHPSSLVT